MEQRRDDEELWALVLAAGRGTRLAAVTKAAFGSELPKQYVALTSRRTLLQETMARIRPVIPAERTVVVVAADQEDLARAQLADEPGVEIVCQPMDRGTGPGVLLGLAHILARNPRAQVGIFPSDHHIHRPRPFLDALRRALLLAGQVPSGVALLGVAAERPACDLGWIVPAERLAEIGARVHTFVEKPSRETALLLLEAGALWNTMVMVGNVTALWRLGRRHLPTQTRALERYVRAIRRDDAPTLLAQLYTQMRTGDFSRDVLQGSPGLAVVPVVDSGWFDCGTPERLFAWLRSNGDPSGILARLHRPEMEAGYHPPAAEAGEALASLGT